MCIQKGKNLSTFYIAYRKASVKTVDIFVAALTNRVRILPIIGLNCGHFDHSLHPYASIQAQLANVEPENAISAEMVKTYLPRYNNNNNNNDDDDDNNNNNDDDDNNNNNNSGNTVTTHNLGLKLEPKGRFETRSNDHSLTHSLTHPGMPVWTLPSEPSI